MIDTECVATSGGGHSAQAATLDRHAGQNCVGQRISHKGHAAENDVAADDGTDDAHYDRGEQTALHESICQGIGEPTHNVHL